MPVHTRDVFNTFYNKRDYSDAALMLLINAVDLSDVAKEGLGLLMSDLSVLETGEVLASLIEIKEALEHEVELEEGFIDDSYEDQHRLTGKQLGVVTG